MLNNHTNNVEIPILPTPSLNPYQLGATLYMPMTRADIWQIITRQKITQVNSIVLCLEDAIADADVTIAIKNLEQLLDNWQLFQQNHEFQQGVHRPLVFIRPRNPTMLAHFATWQTIGLLDGCVLPKVDMFTLGEWQQACQLLPTHLYLMPTLETRAIFNPLHNQELAVALIKSFEQSILALRIGGNDLFACLRLRRPSDKTIYDTPIGSLIYQLLGCFVPYGFYLTAPVFEYLGEMAIFEQELEQDVALGLVGKTIIHPSQILQVKTAFLLKQKDIAEANAILAQDALAIFKQNDTMLEPATHRAWANNIGLRASLAQ